MYQQLIPIILPVFICALIGFAWARSAIPFEREFVTSLVMNIGAPCLVLEGVAGLEADTPAFGQMVLIAGLGFIFCAVAGAIILKLLRQPLRSYLPPVTFGNLGNLGLPLCLFAFGKRGLGLALGFYLAGALCQFVLVPLFQDRNAVWKTLLRTPVIYAALLGTFFMQTGIPMPEWLANAVQLLAGMAIPLMLLAMGHALGSFTVQRARTAFGVAALRLVLGFLAGWALAGLFKLSGVPRGVVIIESAMPVAVFNYLLAARYDRHPDDVAGAILVSTLLSFATLPALLLFALGGMG